MLARISKISQEGGEGWSVEQKYTPLPRYHLQHWQGQHSCRGRWRNGICVFGLMDIGTLLASGNMFANKVRTDYDPIISPCLADVVEGRRKKGADAPFTSYIEVTFCEDMKHGSRGGWGNFLNGSYIKE